MIGRRALTKGKDEITGAAPGRRRNSYRWPPTRSPTSSSTSTIPTRAVEIDARAQPATPAGPAPTGYTGLEGLLNYAYYQTGAINQFDTIGHLLHFILYEFQTGPCANYNAGDSNGARRAQHRRLGRDHEHATRTAASPGSAPTSRTSTRTSADPALRHDRLPAGLDRPRSATRELAQRRAPPPPTGLPATAAARSGGGERAANARRRQPGGLAAAAPDRPGGPPAVPGGPDDAPAPGAATRPLPPTRRRAELRPTEATTTSSTSSSATEMTGKRDSSPMAAVGRRRRRWSARSRR